MPETLQPNPEQMPPSMHTESLNGMVLKTDLPMPVGVLLEPGDGVGLFDMQLRPNMTDQIQAGSYNITQESQDELWGNTSVTRQIGLKETGNGRVIDVGSFSTAAETGILTTGNKGKLFELAGFELNEDGDHVVGVPTPETFADSMYKIGIPVRMSEDSKIPFDEYVHAFSEGEYPISVSDDRYYCHDVGPDHVPGLILGGQELMQALRESATTRLASHPDEVQETATGIDGITAVLSAVTIGHPNAVGEQYGPEKGRKTFYDIAKSIGIDEATAETILKVAQHRAHELGIETTRLN